MSAKVRAVDITSSPGGGIEVQITACRYGLSAEPLPMPPDIRAALHEYLDQCADLSEQTSRG